jgi:NADH-quinone oxidoreductase subunit M
MILVWLILLLILGAILAWISARWNQNLPRWISLISLGIGGIILGIIWFNNYAQTNLLPNENWLIEVDQAWLPQFGIHFHLALDGLSLLLISLTIFLGLLSVLCSWKEITLRVGFFHFNLVWTLTGIIGVFLAMDLFLFYFFWEVMLIPMYFLIGIWGHENLIYAAIKFFIFTQVSGLLLLLAIIGLYLIHGKSTGNYTFNYLDLLHSTLEPGIARWLMFGFLIAFVVKLPAVPFHTWLPDAHAEAPTAGSVILAGLLLKTGAYGILRFVLPIFPQASVDFAPFAMILGIVGILYGAKLAFAQTDLKRMVAYTSVSHMGFILLGIYALNELALQGVVVQMIAHGISTGALFIIAGALLDRIHTRDINRMGGLWEKVPRMAASGMLFAMASLGLPGLGNFIAEFLILLGSFQANKPMAIVATLGLVAATVYALWLVQQVFHGKERKTWKLPDLSLREMIIMGAMIIVIVWLGLFPQPVLNTAKPVLQKIHNLVVPADEALSNCDFRSKFSRQIGLNNKEIYTFPVPPEYKINRNDKVTSNLEGPLQP